jgi:hypothetical protein
MPVRPWTRLSPQLRRHAWRLGRPAQPRLLNKMLHSTACWPLFSPPGRVALPTCPWQWRCLGAAPFVPLHPGGLFLRWQRWRLWRSQSQPRASGLRRGIPSQLRTKATWCPRVLCSSAACQLLLLVCCQLRWLSWSPRLVLVAKLPPYLLRRWRLVVCSPARHTSNPLPLLCRPVRRLPLHRLLKQVVVLMQRCGVPRLSRRLATPAVTARARCRTLCWTSR